MAASLAAPRRPEGGADPGWQATVATSPADLDHIADDWQRLEHRANARLFDSLLYLRLAWDHRPPEVRRLAAVLVRDPTGPVAAAPLCLLIKPKLGLPLRTLVFLTGFLGDQPRILGDDSPAMLAFVLRAVTEVLGPWDRLELAEQTRPDLARAFAPGSVVIETSLASRTNRIAVTGSFAAYMAARPARMRKKLRNAEARLARAGQTARVEILPATDPQIRCQALALFFDLERRSWKAGSVIAASGTPARQAYHADLLDRVARADETPSASGVVFAFLWLGEVCAAGYMVALWGGDALVLHVAHDQAFDAFSPGILLRPALLEALWTPAVRVIDFLATPAPLPAHCHKEPWCPDQGDTLRLIVTRRSLRSGPYLIARAMARRITAAIARLRPVPRSTDARADKDTARSETAPGGGH